MSTREAGEPTREALLKGLILASEGTGPLLQRDYWAVIENCALTPPELADRLRRDFASFAPEDIVQFERTSEPGTALEPGDEMEVKIRMAGSCRVRVLHKDRNSLTLGTVRGHPEAGRITFGAYRNDEGEVVFHIRSRARASSGARYAGYVAAGEPLQMNAWTDFIDRLAHEVGDGVVGAIHVETSVIDDEGTDPEIVCSPTFTALGE